LLYQPLYLRSTKFDGTGGGLVGRLHQSGTQFPRNHNLHAFFSKPRHESRKTPALFTRLSQILGHGFNTFSKYFRVHDQDQRKRIQTVWSLMKPAKMLWEVKRKWGDPFYRYYIYIYYKKPPSLNPHTHILTFISSYS